MQRQQLRPMVSAVHLQLLGNDPTGLGPGFAGCSSSDTKGVNVVEPGLAEGIEAVLDIELCRMSSLHCVENCKKHPAQLGDVLSATL